MRNLYSNIKGAPGNIIKFGMPGAPLPLLCLILSEATSLFLCLVLFCCHLLGETALIIITADLSMCSVLIMIPGTVMV